MRGLKYLIIMSILVAVMVILPIVAKKLKRNYKNHITLEDVPVEFERIYEELYNNCINDLEQKRKKVRWRTIIKNIAFIVFIMGYAISEFDYVIISNEIDSFLVYAGLIGLVIALIFTYKNIKYKRKYVSAYKENIISNYIKLVSNQLNYKIDKVESLKNRNDYIEANFDGRKFNRCDVDDYIEGNIDGNSFVKMCDIHIQNVTGSGKSRNVEEIFEGIFANIQSNRDIGAYIKITKDKLKITSGKDKVEMDSQEFEKNFDVYSENKILAMRILTADIMECLTDFYNKYKLNYEIVLKGSNIYLRFFTGPMFEPRIFGNSMDKELLFTYYCIMKFIVEITQKVNKVMQEIDI